jgi:hypothetical protein
MTTRKWTWIFFAAAVIVYIPGIWWGLPEGVAADRAKPWGTDELAPLGAVNEVYGVFAANKPHFNPQYPLFHYLCQLVLVAPYYVGLWLTGHISYPAPNFPFGLDHPQVELRVLTVLARCASLLAAGGVVAMAFRTAEILRGRTVGILAGSLVLLQYPMFYYARTSNVDMGALFWTALGLMLFARFLMNGATVRLGVALGGVAALAVATKDASYGALLPVGAVFALLHVTSARRSGSGWIEALRVPVYALIAAVTVYLVASGLVFRPSRWIRHVQFITTHDGAVGVFYYRYQATVAGYLSVGRELSQNLIDALGVPMLLASLVGLVLWVKDGRRLLLWLLPALGIILFVIAPVRFVQLRFVLIVAYVLALPAADFLARGLKGQGLVRRFALAAIVVVVAWSGLRGADLTVQMLRDSRYAGAEWLQVHARPGDRIGHFVPAPNLPYLPAQVGTQFLTDSRLVALPEAERPEFIFSIPLRDIERVHERILSEETFRRLGDGSLGYREAALIQGPTLFTHRPATYLNPPLRVFIRSDLWDSRMTAQRD